MMVLPEERDLLQPPTSNLFNSIRSVTFIASPFGAFGEWASIAARFAIPPDNQRGERTRIGFESFLIDQALKILTRLRMAVESAAC
jgi:hypothetical protein